MEPFYDETVQYVSALKKAKIPVEFKEYKGCYHAFDKPELFGEADISKDAFNWQMDMFDKYYDKYTK